MGLTLANLRSELLSHLGMETADFPNGNTDIDLLINRSWWEVMDKLDFREKEATRSFTCTSGTNTYTIATAFGSATIFDAIRKVTLLGGDEGEDDEQQSVLDQMTIDVFNQLYNSDEDNEAQPTHYIRDGSNLILYPTPNAAYVFTLYYQAILADVPSGGPVIPQSWHEVILYGALWRGYLRVGDYNRANGAKSHQLGLISSSTPVKAKELMDDPRAHLEVLGRDY